MATRPKIPVTTVPIVGPDGMLNVEWLRAFQQQAHIGEFATTATAGAGTLPAQPVGFITVYVNGTERKIPFYAV